MKNTAPRRRDGRTTPATAATRDLILTGAIDIFDAISFDAVDRIDGILNRDADALNRPFAEYATCEPDGGWCTPLAAAVLQNKAEAARLLLARGADMVHAPDGRALHEIATEKGREQVALVLREHSLKQGD
jgi:hypothetical protein